LQVRILRNKAPGTDLKAYDHNVLIGDLFFPPPQSINAEACITITYRLYCFILEAYWKLLLVFKAFALFTIQSTSLGT
jgi:hypothetical protein